MDYNTKFQRATLLIVLIIGSIEVAKSCTFVTPKVIVKIHNSLSSSSPVLQVHCRSGDDDLGVHTVSQGGEYSWRFCNSFFQTTVFSCEIQAGFKFTNFKSYDSSDRESQCPSNVCTWIVKDDGVYIMGVRKASW